MAYITDSIAASSVLLEVDFRFPYVTPIVYNVQCLVNTSRTLTFTTNFTDSKIPDCSDFEKPNATVRTAMSHDFTFSGDGTFPIDSLSNFFAWAKDGIPRKARVRIKKAANNTGITVTGDFVLTQFEITGQTKQLATASISIAPASGYSVAFNDNT